MSYRPVPGPALPSALSPSCYLHVDRETNLTRSLLEEKYVEQDSPAWRSALRVCVCLFTFLEYQPLEGRRHTLFIPTAPPTRIIYLNFFRLADTQRMFVLLRFILNEVELNFWGNACQQAASWNGTGDRPLPPTSGLRSLELSCHAEGWVVVMGKR